MNRQRFDAMRANTHRQILIPHHLQTLMNVIPLAVPHHLIRHLTLQIADARPLIHRVLNALES